MNSLFGDFVREFWRGVLGGVRDYLGEIVGGFKRKHAGKLKENYNQKKNNSEQIKKQIKQHLLNCITYSI